MLINFGSTEAINLSDLPISLKDTGKNVYFVQQRLADLGFLNFRPTGYFGNMTKDAVIFFQNCNNLTATGEINTDTYVKLFSADVNRVPVSNVVNRVTGPRLLVKAENYGELMPWKDVKTYISEGTEFVVQDIYTGYKYRVKRVAGKNHADVSLSSEEDTKIFLKTLGGQYTWEKRPVVIMIGNRYIAGSVFGYPRVENGQNVFCIYFYESTSDIAGLPDSEHITNIYIASEEAGSTK